MYVLVTIALTFWLQNLALNPQWVRLGIFFIGIGYRIYTKLWCLQVFDIIKVWLVKQFSIKVEIRKIIRMYYINNSSFSSQLRLRMRKYSLCYTVVKKHSTAVRIFILIVPIVFDFISFNISRYRLIFSYLFNILYFVRKTLIILIHHFTQV